KGIIKKILTDHQALLEIYKGDSSVYSLLITPKRTYFNKIDRADYERTSRLYMAFLSSPDLMNGHMDEFLTTAHHLYEILFKDSRISSGRIIISPDGAYFPFESLIADNSKPGIPVYFIQDHAVSYTYSARYLMNDFANTESRVGGTV